MSNYHFDEESLLELAKGIDDKGFKTTIKCNIGEDGFVESGSLDLLTKPGIYKLQVCLLSDEIKQEIQNGNINFTTVDIFGYCYVNALAESKITIYGQQTVVINENFSKLKAYLINLGVSEKDFSLYIKALPKLLYTRIIDCSDGTCTFSDWEEITDKEVEISINLEAFSDFFTGDDAAIKEAKENIFIVPTDLDPGVYIAKVDITPFIHNLIPEYYTPSMDSSGLSCSDSPSYEECEEVYIGLNCEDVDTGEVDPGGNPIHLQVCNDVYETHCNTYIGYCQLTVEDVTFNGVPINEWKGTDDVIDGTFRPCIRAKLYRTGYKENGDVLEPKTLISSVEFCDALLEGTNTIPTEYGNITITLTSDGSKPSFELYTQTYGKLYLRWQLTVDKNKIPEYIIYNQTLDFTTSFNPAIEFIMGSLQEALLIILSGSGKILRTIINDGNSGWQSIDKIGVNVLNLILGEAPINAEYIGNDGLEISHARKNISSNSLSSSSNGKFQAITAVGVDSWGHVDNITTTNYSVNPATSTQNGLMSSADKTYIESIKPVLTVESDKLSINKDTKITGDTELVGTFRQGSGTVATGLYSHAEGLETKATNAYSHAEGDRGTASGQASHVEGCENTASGSSSHAEGFDTTASGDGSHAEGAGTNASNGQSHAEGLYTKASAIASHAEGAGSIASGNYSHAEGYYSIASNTSHSEGNYTISSGKFSHSEGDYVALTVITKKSATKFLINNSEFIIRAGMYVRYSDDYSKITEVTANSDNLTISLLNELPVDAGLNIYLVTVADNIGSHAEGTSSSSIGSSAHAEGAYSCAAGNRSHAEGYSTFASANLSHTEGYKSIATGNNSHAEGSNTMASGSQAHAEGNNTTASGSHSHAEGNGTVASGYASHAEGYLCKATGDYSRATGVNTTASHLFSNVNGRNTKSSNAYQTVIGRANADKGDALFIIGNGTVNNNNTVNTASNAFVVTSSGKGIFSGSCTASAFPTSSDSRLKDVISDLDISRAYNLIENCSTILYTLKSEADLENKRVQVGLLAQEVKEFFPEIVYEDGDGFLSLDYSRLTVIILKVLKDVINRISILENKI